MSERADSVYLAVRALDRPPLVDVTVSIPHRLRLKLWFAYLLPVDVQDLMLDLKLAGKVQAVTLAHIATLSADRASYASTKNSGGLAFCSRKDTFSVEVGRKVALKRALAPFPREVRKAVWAEYWRVMR